MTAHESERVKKLTAFISFHQRDHRCISFDVL